MQSDRFHLSARELGLIFLFWTSLATLSTVNRLVGAREFGIERVLSSGTVTLAFIEAWTWAALTPFIFWLCSRSNFAQSKWIRIPLLIAIGIAISILVFVVLDFARDAFITVPIRRRPRPPAFAPLREIGRFRFLNQLIVYCAVLATGFAREFFPAQSEARAERSVAPRAACRGQARCACGCSSIRISCSTRCMRSRRWSSAIREACGG